MTTMFKVSENLMKLHWLEKQNFSETPLLPKQTLVGVNNSSAHVIGGTIRRFVSKVSWQPVHILLGRGRLVVGIKIFYHEVVLLRLRCSGSDFVCLKNGDLGESRCHIETLMELFQMQLSLLPVDVQVSQRVPLSEEDFG